MFNPSCIARRVDVFPIIRCHSVWELSTNIIIQKIESINMIVSTFRIFYLRMF